MRLAFNIAQHDTMSDSTEAKKAPRAPSAFREPIYPWILSKWIKADPEMMQAKTWRTFRKVSAAGFVPWVQRQQLVVLWGAMAMAGVIAAWLARSAWATPWALWFCAGSGSLTFMPARFLSVTPAILLLGVVCCLGLWAVRSRRLLVFALWGIALGLLALTQGMFAYAPIACLASLALYAWQRRWAWRGAARSAVVFFVGFCCVVGPWMVRNHHHFGRFYITDRGGTVLSIRAQYDTMTATEEAAAWLYWSKFDSAKRALEGNFTPQQYARLDRSNPKGFYQRGRKRGTGDKANLERSKAAVLANPWRHLSLTPLFAWQGFFCESGSELGPLSLNSAGTSLIAALCFLGFGAVGLSRKRAEIFVLLSPALFCWLAYALLTHNIPRYSHVLLPVWYASLAAFLVVCARAISTRSGHSNPDSSRT